ncbi:MAG: hypothetical protein ACI85K_001400, partial [Hyphomicrobiaceae bacterium]
WAAHTAVRQAAKTTVSKFFILGSSSSREPERNALAPTS